MSNNIWDKYADWSDAAATDSTTVLKQKITGNPQWVPNHMSERLGLLLRTIVSVHADYNVDASVLDFGCGLGRNSPLLRNIFPRLLGLDVPTMIERISVQHLQGAENLYDAIYDDLDRLVQNEKIHVVYDSVVFQHIVDVAYVTQVMDKLLSLPTFQTFVMLKNHGAYETIMQRLLRQQGWHSVLEEDDDISFFGAKHDVVVLRRPHGNA